MPRCRTGPAPARATGTNARTARQISIRCRKNAQSNSTRLAETGNDDLNEVSDAVRYVDTNRARGKVLISVGV